MRNKGDLLHSKGSYGTATIIGHVADTLLHPSQAFPYLTPQQPRERHPVITPDVIVGLWRLPIQRVELITLPTEKHLSVQGPLSHNSFIPFYSCAQSHFSPIL